MSTPGDPPTKAELDAYEAGRDAGHRLGIRRAAELEQEVLALRARALPPWHLRNDKGEAFRYKFGGAIIPAPEYDARAQPDYQPRFDARVDEVARAVYVRLRQRTGSLRTEEVLPACVMVDYDQDGPIGVEVLYPGAGEEVRVDALASWLADIGLDESVEVADRLVEAFKICAR